MNNKNHGKAAGVEKKCCNLSHSVSPLVVSEAGVLGTSKTKNVNQWAKTVLVNYFCPSFWLVEGHKIIILLLSYSSMDTP